MFVAVDFNLKAHSYDVRLTRQTGAVRKIRIFSICAVTQTSAAPARVKCT